MRAVVHDVKRTKATCDLAGGIELRERRKSRACSGVAVGKLHGLQMHARRSDIRSAELENMKIAVEARRPGADVSVAKIPRDRGSSQRLHLTARRQRSEVILKPLNIYGSISGNF